MLKNKNTARDERSNENPIYNYGQTDGRINGHWQKTHLIICTFFRFVRMAAIGSNFMELLSNDSKFSSRDGWDCRSFNCLFRQLLLTLWMDWGKRVVGGQAISPLEGARVYLLWKSNNTNDGHSQSLCFDEFTFIGQGLIIKP